MTSVLASSSQKAKVKAKAKRYSSLSSSSYEEGSSSLYSSSEDEETTLESKEEKRSHQQKKSHKKQSASSLPKSQPTPFSHETPTGVSKIKRERFDIGSNTKKQQKKSKSSEGYEVAKAVDKHREKKKSRSSEGPALVTSKSSQKKKEKCANSAEKMMADLMAFIVEEVKSIRQMCENYIADLKTLSERDNREQ